MDSNWERPGNSAVLRASSCELTSWPSRKHQLSSIAFSRNKRASSRGHCVVFRAELWESLDAYINELVLLLNYIRIVSLDVVQKAVNWHPARHSSIELNYHGGSYIAKMASDLTFLSESPGVQNFTACQFSEANPFLLPIGDRRKHALRHRIKYSWN